MANAFGTVKPTYEKSKRTIGAAQVTYMEGKVKITYLPKVDYKKKDGSMIEVTFPDGKVSKIFEMSAMPAVIDPGFDETLVVTADEDGSIVFAPFNGTYKCTFEGFWKPNGENTPPIWKESEPKTWNAKGKSKTYTTLDFRAYYKIAVNPFFKGVILTDFLRYMFAKNEANGMAAFTFEMVSPTRAKQSPQGQKLLDSLGSGGALDEQIEWPEDGNILPELERRMLKANKMVILTVKDGWVTDITPVSKLSDSDEVVETPAPKRTEQEIKSEMGIAPDDNEM